jgi:hypothetical protein
MKGMKGKLYSMLSATARKSSRMGDISGEWKALDAANCTEGCLQLP